VNDGLTSIIIVGGDSTGWMTAAGHPRVERLMYSELARLAPGVRGVIDSRVAEIPRPGQFVERPCKSPVAA
jgi:hypothetical protein